MGQDICDDDLSLSNIPKTVIIAQTHIVIAQTHIGCDLCLRVIYDFDVDFLDRKRNVIGSQPLRPEPFSYQRLQTLGLKAYARYSVMPAEFVVSCQRLIKTEAENSNGPAIPSPDQIQSI